jgi:hypothetical protein
VIAEYRLAVDRGHFAAIWPVAGERLDCLTGERQQPFLPKHRELLPVLLGAAISLDPDMEMSCPHD